MADVAIKEIYFQKALSNLSAAQICFENELYDASANRAYFAAFQEAIAALLNSGEKPGKFDHKWAQSQFNQKLIKRRKIYPKKLGSYLMEMMVLRHEADYEPKHVGRRKCVEQSR